jgi:hypothetical protein
MLWADAAGDGFGIVLQAREGVKAGFEHAVELDQVAGDARAERADGLDGARGAARDDDAQRPQIATLQLGIVEHRDERRRRAGDERHALARDQLQRGAAAEAVQQHGARAGHDGLQQREVAPVEAERQVDQEDLPLGHVHRLVEDAGGGQRRGEGMRDALGVAGRARGERHAHDRVGRHAIRR